MVTILTTPKWVSRFIRFLSLCQWDKYLFWLDWMVVKCLLMMVRVSRTWYLCILIPFRYTRICVIMYHPSPLQGVKKYWLINNCIVDIFYCIVFSFLCKETGLNCIISAILGYYKDISHCLHFCLATTSWLGTSWHKIINGNNFLFSQNKCLDTLLPMISWHDLNFRYVWLLE